MTTTGTLSPAATPGGMTEVARIHETDELGRFVIEPDVGVRGIGGGFPEVFILWGNVCLFFR